MELKLNNLEINIEGESHSKELLIKISGLPENENFSIKSLQTFMSRRQGDGSYLSEICSTSRREPDIAEFEAGVSISDDTARITDETITAHIENKDVKPKDYDSIRNILRPGHADLGAFLKYGKEGLKTGGGEFSGRMTAGFCLAGGIAKQILEKHGVSIHSYIYQIAGINMGFLDEEDENELISKIEDIKSQGDSCGGIVGCIVKGMPTGIGGAGTEGLEGDFARAMLAIPSAKGIEFGSGFDGSYYTGSINNDEYFLDGDRIITHSNKQGGISGGISTGMNIVMNIAFKPVPSISLNQKSVDVDKMEETTIEISGRHDVCIVPRVLPVVEAVAALVVLDRLEV